MAITGYSVTRIDRLTVVTVSSDLSGTIYYHWYADGSWLGVTVDAQFSVMLEQDEQVEIVCQDTNDAAYDPIANAPAGWPARRTLFWTASADSDVAHYRVEQKKGAGDWTALGTVWNDGSWSFRFLTGVLEDLALYQWRIVPVDEAGNDGTARTIASTKVVRRPDAPRFTISFDPETDKVTYTGAA